jgi:hypothetical protein
MILSNISASVLSLNSSFMSFALSLNNLSCSLLL